MTERDRVGFMVHGWGETGDVPHGRQKDNSAAQCGWMQEGELDERGEEPGEFSVNFLKVLHLVSHYFH